MAVRRFGGRRERPVEDEIEKCDQSFVAAAGIVKGRAVVALDGKNLPMKPSRGIENMPKILTK